MLLAIFSKNTVVLLPLLVALIVWVAHRGFRHKHLTVKVLRGWDKFDEVRKSLINEGANDCPTCRRRLNKFLCNHFGRD